MCSRRAKEAFTDDHFQFAADLNPNAAYVYVNRSQANTKLVNFAEAVADAHRAIELDPSMAKAYLRKGHAFYEEVIVTILSKNIPGDTVAV